MGRLIAIGDIHGMRHLLDELWVKLDVAEDDRVVFLGDYVDRGERSPQVVERLLEIKARYPRTVFLPGNRELMMWRALGSDSDNDAWELWQWNGGQVPTAKARGLAPAEQHEPT